MKIIELTSDRTPELDTEIRFNIATERAAAEELVRFDIKSESDTAFRTALRILRRMKGEGAVQVIAPRDSFSADDTEASYIANKYGKTLGELPEWDFIFVKI